MYAHRVQPDTLDPAHTAKADIYETALAVFGRLLQLDKDGVVQPLLAKSWEISPDGTEIKFDLQRGVKFHDGTDFNAQAVKWNFDRLLDPEELSPRKAELGPFIEEVEAADDYTVIFHLFRPYRPLLAVLASDRPGFLVSPAGVEKYGGGKGGDFGRNPVGAGPFKFVEWVPDTRIVLEKNEAYWEEGKPYLDGIRIVAVKEPSTRLAMLRTGEVHSIWITYVRAQDLPLIEANPDLMVIPLVGAQTRGLLFNISKEPFDNKALRQAVAYSLDRQQLVEVGFGGRAQPAYTLEDSGWAHNPDIRPLYFDLAKAKEKLAEAGYAAGVTIPFGCQGVASALELCEIYQAMMKQAGINADIVQVEPSQMWGSNGALKTVGFKSTGWSHRADPDIRLRWIFHPDGFYNIGGYNNPEVIRLMDDAVTVYDTAKAKALYDQIQDITAEEAIWVYGVWNEKFAAMRKNVHGYIARTVIGENLQELWLE